MLLRVIRHPIAAALLCLAIASSARAGVPVTHTLQLDPDQPPTIGPIEIPSGERIARVQVVSLECAEDGVRAPADVAVRVAYQGFERGRHVAWLALPDGRGLSVDHARHAVRVQVLL